MLLFTGLYLKHLICGVMELSFCTDDMPFFFAATVVVLLLLTVIHYPKYLAIPGAIAVFTIILSCILSYIQTQFFSTAYPFIHFYNFVF
jgi:hypothetical protein